MTVPAGSEDAGLVLSAEEREVVTCDGARVERVRALHVSSQVTRSVGRHLRGEEWTPYCDECHQDWPCRTIVALDQHAARIARTPPPAGDAQGSQEARNGPVSDGDGRGHGRDDESGRGAGL